MKYWIVCLALFAGATSASQKSSNKDAQSRNIAILQANPSLTQLEHYLYWSTINWSQECGASILTSLYLISAITCVTGWSYEPRFRRIRAGSASRNTGGLVLYLDGAVGHPSWSYERYTGDIAVLKLRSPMVFGPVIQQATLASPGTVIPNNIRVSQPGWGRNTNPLLSELQVTTAALNNCARTDGGVSSALNSSVNVLCGAVTGNSNDDVGGPWIFDSITVAIVSGANRYDQYNGVIATNVASYTSWIVDTVNTGF